MNPNKAFSSSVALNDDAPSFSGIADFGSPSPSPPQSRMLFIYIYIVLCVCAAQECRLEFIIYSLRFNVKDILVISGL